jgi:hypothetical protein
MFTFFANLNIQAKKFVPNQIDMIDNEIEYQMWTLIKVLFVLKN